MLPWKDAFAYCACWCRRTAVQRIGHLIRDLRKRIPQDQLDPSRVQTSNKKRAVKKEQDPVDLDAVNEFAAEFRAHGSKLKVAELRDGLRVMGLPMTGKKADLTDRIQEYLDAHGLGGGGGDGKPYEADAMDLGEAPEDDGAASLTKPKHKKARHVLPDDDDD